MSNGQNSQLKRQQYDTDLAQFINDPRFIELDGNGRKDALGKFFDQFTAPYLQFQGVQDPASYQEEFLNKYWTPDKKKEDLAEDLLPDASPGGEKFQPVEVRPEDDSETVEEEKPTEENGLEPPDQPDEIAAMMLSALPDVKKEPSPTGSYANDFFERLGAGALQVPESSRKGMEYTKMMTEIPGDGISAVLQKIGLGPQTSDKIGKFANRAILRKAGRIINYTNAAYDAVKDTDAWQEAFVETPQVLRERSDRYDQLISEYRENGEWNKVLGASMLYGAESLPNSLIAMFGGPAGLAAVGGMAAGEKYDEIKDADMPEYQKKVNALATGSFEALTEMIGTAAIGKVIMQAYKSIGKTATKELVETGLKGWFRNVYKKAGLWTAPVQEAFEESLNQLAENVTDKYTGLDTERDIWDNVEEMAWAGAGGGQTHMTMGVPAKIVKGVQNLGKGKKPTKPTEPTKPDKPVTQEKEPLTVAPNEAIAEEEVTPIEPITIKKAKEGDQVVKTKTYESMQEIEGDIQDVQNQSKEIDDELAKREKAKETGKPYRIGAETFDTKEDFIAALEAIDHGKTDPMIIQEDIEYNTEETTMSEVTKALSVLPEGAKEIRGEGLVEPETQYKSTSELIATNESLSIRNDELIKAQKEAIPKQPTDEEKLPETPKGEEVTPEPAKEEVKPKEEIKPKEKVKDVAEYEGLSATERSGVMFAKALPSIMEKAFAKQKPFKEKFLKRKGLTIDEFNDLSTEKKQELQDEWVNSPELKELNEKQEPETIVPEKPKKPKKPVVKEEPVPEEKPPPDSEEFPDWVQEYSQDSEEVRAAHQQVTESEEGKLEPWQEDLLGMKVNPQSFDKFGDKNLRSRSIALNWFDKKRDQYKGYDKGHGVDDIAQDLSDRHNMEITPQDVIDFILADPGKKMSRANPLIKKLASKYKKLTGEKIEDYQTNRDNEQTAAIAEEKVHNFLTMDIFENEDGTINWEEVKNKKDELSWLLDDPEIAELNKLLEDENRQREIDAELKEDSVSEVETEQQVTGGGEQGPATEGRKLTEQERVLSEVDQKIQTLEDQLKDVRSTRERKLAKLNERRGLFGETDVTKEGSLLDVKGQYKATPEVFKKALEDEDGKIAALEREIANLKKSRDTAGKEAAGQQDLFKDEPPADDNIITKSGVNLFGMRIDDKVIQKAWKKYMRARSNVPLDVFKRWMRAKGNINKNLAHAHFLVRDLKSAMRKAYGQTVVRTPKVSQEELAKINKVLTEMGPGQDRSKVLDQLPEVLHEPLTAMRDHIDAMSREMIRTGLVEGNVDLMIKLVENLGFYLTRTYKAHTDPSWTWENIPDDIKNRAISWVRAENPDMSDERIEGELKGLLQGDDGVFSAISSGKMGQKDLGILKKRKDVPREIQDFLGVYEDPMYNYSTSISKMANLIERQKFLEDMKEMGMGEFLHSKKTGDHTVPIAQEGDYRFHPLSWVNRYEDPETGEMKENRNALFTTPEIAEAFQNFNKADPIHPLTRAYMRWLNVPVKYGKTILSPVTHARNYYANFLFHVMNGRFPFGKAGAKAHATIANELRNKKGDDFRSYYERLVELNVIGESTRAGEVHDAIKDADYMENFDKRGDNIFKKIAKKTLRTLEKAYQIEDDVHKIIAFEGEKSRYMGIMRKRNPDATDAEINRMAEEKAAEIVRNTMPTYSLVPKMIRAIRRVPLVGTFVSFPAEVIRTSANAMGLAYQELQSADTRSIGAMRLAGIMSAATVTGGMAALSRGLLGFDKDDDDDLRRFMASWSAKSELIILANDGGGNYRYVDVGFSDPFNYLKKPLYALLKGDKNWEDKVWDAVKEISEPFIGEELLASRLMDIQRNTTKETGRQVYNPEASPGDQQAEKLKYLWTGVQPGAIYTGKRIAKAFKKELEERGGLDPVNELTNLFLGLRSSPVNVGESYGYKVLRAGKRIGNAQAIFYAVRDKDDVSERDKKKAFKDADNATKAIILELHEDYKAGLRLGAPQEVLVEKIDNLKSGKFQASNSVKKMVVTGKYVGLDPETGHFRKPRKGYKLK